MKKLSAALLLVIFGLISLYTPILNVNNENPLSLAQPTYAAGPFDAICALPHPILNAAPLPVPGVLGPACDAYKVSQAPGGIGQAILDFFSSIPGMNQFWGTIILWFDSITGSTGSIASGPVNSSKLAIVNPSDPKYLDNYGLVGAVTAGLDQATHPQGVSSVDYLASIHPIGTVSATGYDQLSGQQNTYTLNSAFTRFLAHKNLPDKPILQVWQLMRNIAYSLFIIILVVIGFMLMFRAKIDPRTVVTITSAIPSLVISLVMITFSFAIAGLMVDLMNVMLAIVQSSFNQWVYLPPNLGLSGLFDFAILPAYNFQPLNGCNAAIENCLPSMLSNLQVPSLIIAAILQIAFRLAAIIIILMLLFRLVVKWVVLIFLTIFSPFFFLLGALPGRGGMYINWFKQVATVVVTFPAVLAILYIAIILDFAAGLAPPQPVGSVISGGDVGGLLVLAGLFLASRVPEMVENAFDTIAPSHVAKGGFQPSQIPIIGGLMK